jgi:hypothetical protein
MGLRTPSERPVRPRDHVSDLEVLDHCTIGHYRSKMIASYRGRSIRYRLTTEDLESVLADPPYRYEGLLDTWVPYRFYPGVGVAARVGQQKTVEELVVVRSVEQ